MKLRKQQETLANTCTRTFLEAKTGLIKAEIPLGFGKTVVVVEIARKLESMGRKPIIVLRSRAYAEQYKAVSEKLFVGAQFLTVFDFLKDWHHNKNSIIMVELPEDLINKVLKKEKGKRFLAVS